MPRRKKNATAARGSSSRSDKRPTACDLDRLREKALRRSRELYRTQLKWRRHLHSRPELSFQEFETTDYLRDVVTSLGLKVRRIKTPTGLLVDLPGARKEPVVAVRSDIDALPVHEQTGLKYRSRFEGRMHACGHDMHMAAVLGAAHVLHAMADELPGSVRFIFQPAEEEPPGGAVPMIENGALKGVSMVFGLHVDPNLAIGRVALRDGPSMASVTDFDLIVHGRGGHAAKPHLAIDAVTVACEIVQALQQVVSRRIDPLVPAAVSIGRIEGGAARNVVADRVVLNGTARALSAREARQLPRLIRRIAQGVAKAHGARVDMHLQAGYPVVKNHPGANRILNRNYRALFPDGTIDDFQRVLGGEDFAYYLQEVPGAMFFLGVRNEKIGACHPWHSPQFHVDETALTTGTALLAASVVDYLCTTR